MAAMLSLSPRTSGTYRLSRMFQPMKGIRKLLAFDTHLKGRQRPKRTRMSASEAWLETRTAPPRQGRCCRPSTRRRQKGLLQKKSWAQKHE